MTDNKDKKNTGEMNDLASQYLDLWQNQLGSLAENKETTEVIAKTLELMNSGSAAFATMAAGAQSGNDPENSKPNPAKSSKSDNDATSSTPASGAANPDIDQLLERIAALEKRVNTLESAARSPRKKTPARPRKSTNTV